MDLSKWAPGLTSEIEQDWAAHKIPGQRGRLQEDLGEGSLVTNVQLQFTARADYKQVMDHFAKNRRGDLFHPRRGTRPSVIKRLREEVRWTERGETTIVDTTFEDATLSTADQFQGGAAAQAQAALQQVAAAESGVATFRNRVFQLNKFNLAARARVVEAQNYVTDYCLSARQYLSIALGLYRTGQFAFFATLALPGEIFDVATGLLNQLTTTVTDTQVSWTDGTRRLRSLPGRVAASAERLRAAGSPEDTHPTVAAAELSLFYCTQTDAAIRAAQPVPITTEVTRAGGQSIYAFVQQWYGGTGRTPTELRSLVSLILRLNPEIRTPSLIPFGTPVMRPLLP